MITTYEVRNVLRVYGDHLKKKSQFEEKSDLQNGPSDLVDISIGARRKQMLSQMSNQLISRVAPSLYENNVGEKQQLPASKLLVSQG